MTNAIPITKLYETQISLTEWFQQIQHPQTEAHRKEDNEKRERLDVLNKIISLPKELQTNFTAQDVANQTSAFKEFLKQHADEQCAMRLIPKKEGLPKLRMRGHMVRDVVEKWFPEQKINPAEYTVEFIAHPQQHFWSTIFIVNQHGIYGEIIAESHQYLTQGFYTTVKPIAFAYDLKKWKLTPANPEAEKHLRQVVSFLHVANAEKRKALSQKLNATFAHDYLCGYFESVDSEFGTWFIDYNRLLGEQYKDFTISHNTAKGDVTGCTGNAGTATGHVRIITSHEENIEEGDILVCDMTTPAFVPLMQKARAIITNRGGILCHAAIIARELKIPCIVGTEKATKILKDGDHVEVDATKGTVRILA